MPFILVGNQLTELVEEPGSEIVITKEGIANGTISYKIRWERAVDAALSLTAHPSYPWLLVKQAVVRYEEAGMATLLVDYEGVPLKGSSDGGTVRTYSLRTALSSSPIETHPDFVTDLGGLAGAELNGATFDERGVFTGFAGAFEDYDLGGVRTFFEPSLIYSEVEVRSSTSQAKTTESLAKLGKIDKPPFSKALPKLPSGYNWLFLGSDIEEVGDGVRISRSWRASGARGWNARLYS